MNAAALQEDMARVAAAIRRRSTRGVFRGSSSFFDQAYLTSCRLVHAATATTLIFTRDTGYHSSGWWKNPDYERCEHLSISPTPSALILPDGLKAEPNKETQRLWVAAFFREQERLLWVEGPYSALGRKHGVWHFRLFFNETWEAPILPRGEVYSKQFTERGWHSFSELQAAAEADRG